MAQLKLEVIIENAQAAASLGEVKKQLRALKDAMLTVGEDSDEFKKLATAAAQLKDKVGEANEKIEAMNPDKFKGLSTMAKGAATGIQLVTSGMALLGVESEDTQKMMMKVQAAMAFSQAINQIDDLKKGFKELGDTIRANPIVAFAAALTALGIALYKVWSAQQDANSELAIATREYEKQQKVTAALSREYEREIDLLTAQGASTEEIITVKRKLIETQMLEISQGITMHEKALQAIDDNDNLWESLLKVADVVNGTNQSEAAIALNKKERKAEELTALEEQKQALKDLQNEILILDAQEETAAKKKGEDSVKLYNERKAIKDQELLDDEKFFNDQLAIVEAEMTAAEDAEIARTDMLAAHDQHRLAMYNADKAAKMKARAQLDAAEKKLDEAKLKREQMINQFKIDAAKSALGTIGELFKDNAKVQKAVGAATTLIDTYGAAQAAFRAASASPITTVNPAYPFIAAGLAVAAGLARVAAILRVDTSGGSVSATSGGASGGGGSLQTSSQPNISSGTQPTTLLTEQGTVANQQTNQGNMYVSVTEIRETSNTVQAIEERSRF
tara:strand:- start:3245 stop:4933 length:1689 start_codon:yes stop_codon:yes gene_type:complete